MEKFIIITEKIINDKMLNSSEKIIVGFIAGFEKKCGYTGSIEYLASRCGIEYKKAHKLITDLVNKKKLEIKDDNNSHIIKLKETRDREKKDEEKESDIKNKEVYYKEIEIINKKNNLEESKNKVKSTVESKVESKDKNKVESKVESKENIIREKEEIKELIRKEQEKEKSPKISIWKFDDLIEIYKKAGKKIEKDKIYKLIDEGKIDFGINDMKEIKKILYFNNIISLEELDD